MIDRNNGKASVMTRLGLLLAFLFYMTSAIYVLFVSKDNVVQQLDDDTTVVTIAHWQLEDGFREGLDSAIESYQFLKNHEFDKFQNLFRENVIQGFYRALSEYSGNQYVFNASQNASSDFVYYQLLIEQIINSKSVGEIDVSLTASVEKALAEIYRDDYICKDFVEQLNSIVDTYQRRIVWSEEIIKRFRSGSPEKIKIVQTTVPFRAYGQWFRTQLVGGKPADIIELVSNGKGDVMNQYFKALSPFISEQNLYNSGTVLQNYSWKNSFVESMESSFDKAYADYYGIGMFCSNLRMFVNLDLLEKATGSKKMPEDLTQWLEMCEKIVDYQDKRAEKIIPIGVRGLDKETLRFFFKYYYSQLNGNLADEFTRCVYRGTTDSGVDGPDVIEQMEINSEFRSRILSIAILLNDIGQYFSDGFTALDLEQVKYLFFTGRLVFLCEGTWNGYSLIRNSPFPVGTCRVPVIGDNYKLSKYYTGPISESTSVTQGKFGIPKVSENFDIALDFIKYISSYEINQMVMERAKWLPAVKKSHMGGFLDEFMPVEEGNVTIDFPFMNGYYWPEGVKYLEAFENIINNDVTDPEAYFMKRIRETKDIFVDKFERQRDDLLRSSLTIEMTRSRFALSVKTEYSENTEIDSAEYRYNLLMENYASSVVKKLRNREIREIREFE